MTSDAPSRVLLIGPPNVGKSLLFNRLTGLHVYVANYAGATVGYHLGQVPLPGKTVTLVDVPGIYTLSANNAAEQLAIDLLSGQSVRPSRPHCGSPRCPSTHCAANQATATDSEQDASVAVSAAPAPTAHPAAIVFVLDACNLESSLFLLLQVLAHQRPTVVVVNRMDLAEERGLSLDLNRLSQALGINVLPCVAQTGKGIEAIRSALAVAVNAPTAAMQPTATQPSTSAALWVKAENLAQLTQGSPHRSRPRTTRQLWGERLVKPWPGMALALVVMAVAFGLIVGLGMGLRKYVLLPVIREHIIPGLSVAVEWVTAPGMLRNVLIGDYGLLVKGLEWPFALVLPYVISFYLTLGLLEDSGYLARLGSLLDGLLSRLGLPGTGAIPLLLGYGCGIPAIMASRTLASYKQRLIVTYLVSLTVPCVAQTGAFIALLSEHSVTLVLLLFGLSFMSLLVVGIALNRFIPGSPIVTLIEIPDLLMPQRQAVAKKLWLRVKGFLYDGAIPMFFIIGFAAILYESGAMGVIGQWLRPVVVGGLHLPEEAATPLVLGILRRELTVLPLLDMELTSLQLFTAAVVGLFYVPCVAMIAAIAREFTLATATAVTGLTIFVALLLGAVVAQVGGIFL